MEVAGGTEPGTWQQRESDAYFAECIAPNVLLFVVADGFGEAGRRKAPAPLAIAAVRDCLRRHLGSFSRNVSPAALRALLLSALDHANGRLYSLSGSHEDYVASGASLTAVMVVDAHAFVGHVGDARAYLLRGTSLERLTADDALFAGAAVTGLRQSLPAKPRTRGLLWRSFGTQARLEASIGHVELLPNDRLVLCTDGLYRTIDEDEIVSALLLCDDAAAVVARLLAIVKARGSSDAATLVVGANLSTAIAPPVVRHAFAAGPARRLIALLAIVATLLFSFGLYALRTEPDDRSATTFHSNAR